MVRDVSLSPFFSKFKDVIRVPLARSRYDTEAPLSRRTESHFIAFPDKSYTQSSVGVVEFVSSLPANFRRSLPLTSAAMNSRLCLDESVRGTLIPACD